MGTRNFRCPCHGLIYQLPIDMHPHLFGFIEIPERSRLEVSPFAFGLPVPETDLAWSQNGAIPDPEIPPPLPP